jgi:hypothetical protein
MGENPTPLIFAYGQENPQFWFNSGPVDSLEFPALIRIVAGKPERAESVSLKRNYGRPRSVVPQVDDWASHHAPHGRLR